ncbi:hypothetical protein EVAR_19631_1 [Eumeta japonica]|uniref:Uncharacterized protein n=1 Tax=Eumeta variegata TaxID=151549 RepID=A0A4C1UFN6_EUMVA|nr:hypothetical protein EVAR_19631_1 [Eumeta japonica]
MVSYSKNRITYVVTKIKYINRRITDSATSLRATLPTDVEVSITGGVPYNYYQYGLKSSTSFYRITIPPASRTTCSCNAKALAKASRFAPTSETHLRATSRQIGTPKERLTPRLGYLNRNMLISAVQNRIHTADGSSAVCEADHASLRLIKSNLQRSKLAKAELLVGASRRKIAVALVQEPYVGNAGELKRYSSCRVIQRMAPRAEPVKAAILILDSDVDFEEDQTLFDVNVITAVITAG